MKVGLVRHFKVKYGFPEKKLVSPAEVLHWFTEYDKAEIELGKVDLGGVDWKRCFASDLPRAIKTAEAIYQGDIIQTAALREIQAAPVVNANIRLPFILWGILVRLAWLTDHSSQPESQSDIARRLGTALDEILSHGEEDVLIVSHGACMMFMRKELLKRGFTGPKLGTPENGKLYIFER